jgi:hypothetical protein
MEGGGTENEVIEIKIRYWNEKSRSKKRKKKKEKKENKTYIRSKMFNKRGEKEQFLVNKNIHFK